MCKIISIANQKGGTSKTTTVNLGIGLSRLGKRVLVIDNDPQGSMTASLGYRNPDELVLLFQQYCNLLLLMMKLMCKKESCQIRKVLT